MPSSLRSVSRAVRSRSRSSLASLAVLALATGGLLLAGVPQAASATDDPSAGSSSSSTGSSTGSASTAPTTSPSPSATAAPQPSASPSTTPTTTPAYVIALWKGGAGQQWPVGGQHLVTSQKTASTALNQLDASATECGITYQVDLYANNPTTANLIYGGVLHSANNPTESWPGGAYQSSYSKVFTNPACATPSIQVNAGACLLPVSQGGSSAITADVKNTLSGHTYVATLSPSGSTTTFAGGAASVHLDFGQKAAGIVYSVTVKDQSNPYAPGISGSAQPASCPEVGDLSLDITPCSTVGGTATLAITSDAFVSGRTYQVHSGSATGPAVGAPFTATVATGYTVAIAPSATSTTRTLYVVDTASGVAINSGGYPVTLEPCPAQPQLGSMTVEPCTVGATSSDIIVNVSGLVPGRAYVVTLDGTVPGRTVTHSGTVGTVIIPDVSPGAHTVSVTDVATNLTSTQSVTVAACAAIPQLALTPQQCSVPNGTTSLQSNLSGLVAGRGYTVKVTSNGQPVPNVADQSFTADGPTKTVSFGTLPANASYTVTATDDSAATATTSTTVRMTTCPSLPEVGAVSIECTTAGGVGTLSVGAADLAAGQVWSITFERQTATGWTVVKQRSNMTSLTAADLRYAPVNPGQTYRVTLASQTTPALNDSAIVPIPDGCTSTTPTGKVGGVQYTARGRVASLALTGTDTGRLVILALLLLVPGAGLLGFALLRHRKEVGD